MLRIFKRRGRAKTDGDSRGGLVKNTGAYAEIEQPKGKFKDIFKEIEDKQRRSRERDD